VLAHLSSFTYRNHSTSLSSHFNSQIIILSYYSKKQLCIIFLKSKNEQHNGHLIFIGPCIANTFAEYNQQDAAFHNLFISVRRCTCLNGFSVHHQELKTAHTASGICQTITANCC